MAILSWALIVLGNVLTASSPAWQTQPAPLRDCFVDEAKEDPTLATFRDQLLGVVKSRSVERLVPLVARDIFVEIGASGVDTLLSTYNLKDPKSPYWTELEDILRLGGRFEGHKQAFCAPFNSCPFPRGLGRDYFTVLGSDVPAYSEPSNKSQIVARLKCDVLRASGEGLPPAPRSSGTWIPLWLPSGRWGFVDSSQVRSPAEMVILIGKVDGKWLLTMFTAPD